MSPQRLDVLSVDSEYGPDSRIFVTMSGGGVMVACNHPTDAMCIEPSSPALPLAVAGGAVAALLIALCGLVLVRRRGRGGGGRADAAALSAHVATDAETAPEVGPKSEL